MNPTESTLVAVSASGLHILSRCFDCDFNYISELSLDEVDCFIRALVQEHGLTQMGQVYCPFGTPGAWTAAVVLAESHICIHTWPEYNMVTLDVFVCNVSQDNSEVAHRFHDDLVKSLFRPTKTDSQSVKR